MTTALTPDRKPTDEARSNRAWSWALLIVPLVVGLLVDLSIRTPMDGAAAFVAIACLVAGLVTVGPVRSGTGRAIVVTSLIPAAFLFIRTSPWVVTIDVIATGVLIAIGVSSGTDGRLFDIDFSRIGMNLTTTAARTTTAPARAFASIGRRVPAMNVERRQRYAAIVRGVCLALPIVLVIGLLLASADGVFASLFHLSFDAAALSGHLALILFAAWIAAGFLFQTGIPAVTARPARGVTIGPVEGSVVLGGLIAVYALFAWARLLVALRGSDYVVQTTGLTYAEYARSGFFQLLWAAGVTLLVLLGLRAVVVVPTARARRAFAALSLAAVALTLVLVHAAIVRLELYDDVFGLTMLRLYSTMFAWWIGAVFVLTGLALAGVARGRRWLAGAVLCSAVFTLLFVNVRNPEDVVVQRNADRVASGAEFDVVHALSLSDDARPALVDALPSLSASDRDLVLRSICRPVPDGSTTWNVGARRASDATIRACTVG